MIHCTSSCEQEKITCIQFSNPVLYQIISDMLQNSLQPPPKVATTKGATTKVCHQGRKFKQNSPAFWSASHQKIEHGNRETDFLIGFPSKRETVTHGNWIDMGYIGLQFLCQAMCLCKCMKD